MTSSTPSSALYTRLLMGLVILIFTGVVASGAQAAALSPASLMSRALHDATMSHWVQERGTLVSNGSVVMTAMNSIGTTEGTQTIVFTNGATATVMYFASAHRAYVKANLLGLTQYMQMAPSLAPKYSNKWLVLTPSNPTYAAAIDATTLSSDFSHVSLTGPVSLGPTYVVAGIKTRALEGKMPTGTTPSSAKATLYVSTAPAPLPVEEVAAAGSLSVLTKWSNWGQVVHLRVPSSPVPYPV